MLSGIKHIQKSVRIQMKYIRLCHPSAWGNSVHNLTVTCYMSLAGVKMQ